MDLASSHQAGFDATGPFVASLVSLLLATIMIHIAAKMVLDKSSLLSAFLTALIGTLLGQVVAGLVGGTLGLFLALATWALIAAVFYRTKWVKGAIVGLVAWVLWFLINLAVRALFG